MDGTNWPSLVDFQGPNGWINQRQPSARMTLPLTDRLFWATSIERPFSDITTNGLGDQRAGRARLRHAPALRRRRRATCKCRALMRSIGYRPTGGDVTRRTGVGPERKRRVPSVGDSDGHRPGRRREPVGPDAQPDPAARHVGPGRRPVRQRPGRPGTWTARSIRSRATSTWWTRPAGTPATSTGSTSAGSRTSRTRRCTPTATPISRATTYDTGKYLAVSLWWIPVPRMSFGIEYMWGERENLDGAGRAGPAAPRAVPVQLLSLGRDNEPFARRSKRQAYRSILRDFALALDSDSVPSRV